MRLDGRRVLVTGASGFLGGHVMAALRASGAKPVGFHRQAVPPDLSGDVSDSHALSSAVASSDAIVHLACSPGYRSFEDPVGDLRANAEGTLNVAVAAQARGVPLVHASTSHVFGHTGGRPVSETAPKAPLSPYGVSKLAAESYVAMLAMSRGMTAKLLRFAPLFGVPAHGMPPRNVVTRFTDAALAGGPIVVRGDSTLAVDLLDVRQAARAVVVAVEDHQPGFGDYNIGSGAPLRLGDLADLIRKAVDPRIDVQSEDRTGPPEVALLDPSRAQAELGLAPPGDPSSAILDFVQWRTKHPG